MSHPPAKRVTQIDVSTLETIYADGRAMGRLLEDFKEDNRKLMTENAKLKCELITCRYRLKAVTSKYESLARRAA